MVWFAFIVMTVAAVLCVTLPLLRPARRSAPAATDIAFYRRQIEALDTDVERRLLPAAEREGVQAELGRRLLRAVDRSAWAAPASSGPRVAAAALAGCFVLGASVALYARVGSPGQPDAPLAARRTSGDDFAAAMAKIEAHLASAPDDGRGFDLVAPIYMKMGRADDAARAYRAAIRTLGASPARLAGLGQAIVMGADGVVTAEAREAFDAALRGEPRMAQARFFVGLAALQDGDRARARGLWAALLAEAPPEAPYAGVVRQRLAELDGTSGAATAADGPPPAGAADGARPVPVGIPEGGATIAALPADQQKTAIRGMVDGLAARLAANGQDAEGWLRLVRAYRVLGEDAKARQALVGARQAMAGDPQVLGRIDALAHELGLEG